MATLKDYCNTGDDSNYSVRSTWFFVQTFTASSSYEITSVKVQIFKTGTPVGNLNINIYEVDVNHKPTGASLTSGSIVADSISTVKAFVEIALTPYQLTSGTEYAIVVSCPDSSVGNLVNWRKDAVNSYVGGVVGYSGDSGSTWSVAATDGDAMFETYGDEIAADSFNFFQLF